MRLRPEQISSINERLSACSRDLHALLVWLPSRPDFSPRDPLYLAVKESARRVGETLIHLHYLSCDKPGGAPTVDQRPPEL